MYIYLPISVHSCVNFVYISLGIGMFAVSLWVTYMFSSAGRLL